MEITQFYNAYGQFKAKAKMERLSINKLKVRDVVLVEVNIQRFKTVDKDKPEWREWPRFLSPSVNLTPSFRA